MATNKLLFAILAVFLLIGVVSAAPQLIFASPTPANGATINNGVIDYRAELMDVSAENVVDFDVVLYTDKYAYVYGDSDWSDTTTVEGSFMDLPDGKYILYAGATFDDGSVATELIRLEINRDVSVNNPTSVAFADPTPLNHDVVNSYSINSAKIVAVADEEVDNLVISFFDENASFIEDINYNDVKEAEYDFYDFWQVHGDGLYQFNVTAEDGSGPVSTPTRTIRIKAVVPNATGMEVVALPESVNEDTEFSFGIANITLSEQPVKVRMVATKGFSSKTLGNYDLTNYSGELLGFTSSIADPGQYEIVMIVSDDYGNSNKYTLANITVNDLPEAVEERRRGGRSSNNDNDEEAVTPTSRFNLTLTDLNDQKEEEPEEEVNTDDEGNKGFFSFITGAVTGAFSTPPRAVLTFIILVVIIYAIVKIRGYIVADGEKPKKNGKKSKVKEKVEVEETESE